MGKKELVLSLFDIDAIKFGDFTLASGIQSPHYIDLSTIISYPSTLQNVSKFFWEKIEHLEFDTICGVPYKALPIATAISLNHSVRMIMTRKKIKAYGTKKAIEGSFKKGDRVVVIEDLFTTGGSALETIKLLENEGLHVTDVVILIDREHGGVQRVEKMGYNVHVVLTIFEVLSILQDAGKICKDRTNAVKQFISTSQISL